MILDDVIDLLVTKFATATGVAVYDGPVPSSVNSGDFVLVGSTGEDEDGAVVEQAPSTLGPGTWLDEQGDIVCSAWSWSGGEDIAVRRARALELAGGCVEALLADRKLGGLLLEPAALVSGLRYQPRQSEAGAIVRVVFTVQYKAVVQ